MARIKLVAAIADALRGSFQMRTEDAGRWWEARTLTDLGALTAEWLEGGIDSQPGYEPGYGPDDETEHLVPVLAAANRAGYLTNGSQPGCPPEPGYDDAIWVQRAGVTGFASAALAQRIHDVCTAAGMLVYVYEPAPGLRGLARWREHGGITVTTRAGRSYTWFGGRLRPRDIRFSYDECGGCHREAVAAVIAAQQVTIVDPVWGRNDVLWPLLAEATR